MIYKTTVTAMALLLAGPALADGDALFLRSGGEARSVRSSFDASLQTLGDRQFQITSGTASDPDAMRAALADYIAGLDADTDIAVVLLSGRFANGRTGTYLLPDGVTAADPAGVLTDGLPVDNVLAVLGAYPGHAALILAEAAPLDDGGFIVDRGIGAMTIPQGVTVFAGLPEDVAPFVARDLPRRGLNLTEAGRVRGLEVSGYAPSSFVLVPIPDTVEGQNDAVADARAEADEALWDRVSQRDDIEAYRDYLGTFPNGLHASAARQRIAAIEAEPFRKERIAEEALDLSRDARREIQRDLSLLGYNTRGIDGIFGPGSRGAIRSWQQQSGFAQSGYLSREQIVRLDGQAETRAAELEEEARRKQAEQERLDRAYWEETGARGDLPGLRAYLKRYPDGVYAEVAQDRLAEIEDLQRDQAAEQDLGAWNQANEAGTIEAYQSYIDRFSDGAFVEQARTRIDALSISAEERRAIERAQAEEQALGLNRTMRQLTEDRLTALGLKPGEVDGAFDDSTRRALRRYQQARGLTVTGYLDQETVVRLMADSILR
ncbi:peptidoglycan-binding protein [Pseudoprimorskyibacter insulae]|uniref:Peptidoglycan binding-like domain-containing protein n=1 Tax=Pseudoprimorskyibacter insulae TaxID=1695997 RepID=A0A2R8AUX0_9RHOB|nr:peptidoglycan-binding protein [Pseudoprimorskyibacter insulae]SPF79790.1 hypothetical protein PRI8871_01587 [Pseudoprimorskyibacter insulae]